MSVLLTGIGQLVTNDPEVDGTPLGVIADAAVVVDDAQVIEWVGRRVDAPPVDTAHAVGDRTVVPGFVDSHTHLVFAGDRSAEFAARMRGERYDGGGIASTVEATRAASDDELRRLLRDRMWELTSQGTTTVEIKSGYGLSVADEARMLQIAQAFTDETTFLGAHVVPAGVDRVDYLDLVTGPMLDACAPHARWIDVFCEPGSAHAFDADEAGAVLSAGRERGLGLRVHGNQLGPGPGVQLAVEYGAASVDHCTYLADADVDALAGGDTVATLLPGVEFSTRSPYPDARRLLGAGITVALATDCNPGTCYSSSMAFMIATAVREMHLTPEQALHAATAGGARALRRDDIGRIAVGMRADFALVDAPSYLHLAYRPGVPITHDVRVGGRVS